MDKRLRPLTTTTTTHYHPSVVLGVMMRNPSTIQLTVPSHLKIEELPPFFVQHTVKGQWKGFYYCCDTYAAAVKRAEIMQRNWGYLHHLYTPINLERS